MPDTKEHAEVLDEHTQRIVINAINFANKQGTSDLKRAAIIQAYTQARIALEIGQGTVDQIHHSGQQVSGTIARKY